MSIISTRRWLTLRNHTTSNISRCFSSRFYFEFPLFGFIVFWSLYLIAMLLTFKEVSALWIKHSEFVNLPAHFNCVRGLSLSCCSYPYWRVWQIVLLANLSAKSFRFFSFSFGFLFIFFAPNVSPLIVISLFQIVFFLNFLDTLFAAFCSVLIFIAVFLRFINFVACYRSGASPSHFQMIVLMVTENKTTKLNLTSELPGDIDI